MLTEQQVAVLLEQAVVAQVRQALEDRDDVVGRKSLRCVTATCKKKRVITLYKSINPIECTV